MKPSKALLLGAVLIAASPAEAEVVYKWTDASGATHYSQEPPPSVRSTPLDVTPPPRTAPPMASAPARSSVAAQASPPPMAASSAKPAASAAPPAATGCAEARAELARLVATRPALKGRPTSSLYDPESGKEVPLMNNAERSLRIEQAEEAVRRLCR